MSKDHVKNALLLLPSPPPKLSFSTIRAVYEAEIQDVLSFVQSNTLEGANKRQILHLDIAITSQHTLVLSDAPRSFSFVQAQRLIGLLYQLIELSTIEFGPFSDRYRFDYRIFYVQSTSNGAQLAAGTEGPLINLLFLACNHQAEVLLVGQSEEAKQLEQDFLKARGKMPLPKFISVRSGTVMKHSNEQRSDGSVDGFRKPHYTVAVGGTFDHLHAGHKLLLTATAYLLEPNYDARPVKERCLIVGITGDELLKNKQYADQMESWEVREERVFSFLSSIMMFWAQDDVSTTRLPRDELNRRAVHHTLSSSLTIKCVEILDAFGPTITDESITALVLSGETRSGGSAVNDKRCDQGWPPLELFEVDVLDQSEDDKDFGGVMQDFRGKISSTDIRRRLHEQATRRPA